MSSNASTVNNGKDVTCSGASASLPSLSKDEERKYIFKLKNIPGISSGILSRTFDVSKQKVEAKYHGLDTDVIELRWDKSKRPMKLLDYIIVNLKLLAVALGFVKGKPTVRSIHSVQLLEELLTKLENVENNKDYRDRICSWWHDNRDLADVLYIRNVNLEEGLENCNVYPSLQQVDKFGSLSHENLLSFLRDKGYSGLIVPWLYIGGLGSAFGLHLEDCLLDGVNAMVPIDAEDKDTDFPELDKRVVRIYNRLSFKRWYAFEGTEDQLLQLQTNLEEVMALPNDECSVSYETINSRRFYFNGKLFDSSPFEAVDQLPGDVVVVSQAHMGTGFGGINISWNCLPVERLEECVEFIVKHHERVRTAFCGRFKNINDVVQHAAVFSEDWSFTEVVQPTFSLLHFLQDLQARANTEPKIAATAEKLLAKHAVSGGATFSVFKKKQVKAHSGDFFYCDVCRWPLLHEYFFVKGNKKVELCLNCIGKMHENFPEWEFGQATLSCK